MFGLIPLETCKKTRNTASKSFETAMRTVLQSDKKVSEALFRDLWLSELRKSRSIFPDGWYTPPPHGIAVLFGNERSDSRVDYNSLRSERMWPKEGVFLDEYNKMAYFYASPVNRNSGVIGDFGMSIYFGDDPEVKKYLQLCLQLDYEIFDFIEVGKTFAEVFKYAERRFKRHGFEEPISISTTDPAGADIGHTVPSTDEAYTKEELNLLRYGSSDWMEVKDMISLKRRFINRRETLTFQEGMAVTIEPRPTFSGKSMPAMSSYHTIAVINTDGTKELLTNFDEIFELVGMDYMLNVEG